MKKLVLSRLDNIGDFILWLDTAKEYRTIYPEYHILLIVKSVLVDFAKEFDYWDEVIAFERIGSPRSIKADILINPTFSRVYAEDKFIGKMKIPEKIASIGDYSNISNMDKIEADKFYTRLIPAASKPLMEFDRNSEFINNLSPMINHLPCLPNIPNIENIALPKRFDEDYILIVPSASWEGKMWEHEKFVALIDRIYEKLNLKVVLCGSKTDYDLCQTIIDKSHGEALNYAGRTTILELAALIKRAKALVGNDTSSAHIAIAVQTPSICILGGGHFGRFAPYPNKYTEKVAVDFAYSEMECYNCNWICIEHTMRGYIAPCIQNISVEDVWKKLLNILQIKNSHLTGAEKLLEIKKQTYTFTHADYLKWEKRHGEYIKLVQKQKSKKINLLQKFISFCFTISHECNITRIKVFGVRVIKIVREYCL